MSSSGSQAPTDNIVWRKLGHSRYDALDLDSLPVGTKIRIEIVDIDNDMHQIVVIEKDERSTMADAVVGLRVLDHTGNYIDTLILNRVGGTEAQTDRYFSVNYQGTLPLQRYISAAIPILLPVRGGMHKHRVLDYQVSC
jgi:hypothetical protein